MRSKLYVLLCGTACAVTAFGPGLQAQQEADYFDRTDVVPVSERLNPETDPLPIPEGSFNFRPEVAFSFGSRSNVRADALNEVDDTFIGISPGIAMESDWARHALGGSLVIEHVEFSDLTDESWTDYDIGLNGRLDVGAKSSLNFDFFAEDQTEDRQEITNIPNSIEANEFTRVGTEIGFSHQAGRFLLEGSLGGLTYGYDDTELEGDLFQDQDFRDHDDLVARSRAAFAINRSVAVYTDIDHTEADYEEPNIFNAFNRDHSGTVLLLGSDFVLGDTISGDIGLGYQYYTYDDATFEDISDFAFAGHLDWKLASATTLSAEAARAVIDPGFVLTNAAIETQAGLRLEQGLSSKVFLTAEAGYTQYEFETIERDDDRVNFSLGANWKLNPNLWLEGGYEVTDQTSDFQEFTDNRMLLRMRIFP